MVKHKVCTLEEKSEICKLYLETDMTMKEIAHEYQISEKSIQRFLKEAKVGFKRKQKAVSFDYESSKKLSKKDQLANEFVDKNMRNRNSETGELVTSQNYTISRPTTSMPPPISNKSFNKNEPVLPQKVMDQAEQDLRKYNVQLHMLEKRK